MKVLFVDNKFSQDLEALLLEIGSDIETRVIHAEYFAAGARRHLPPEAFSTRFEAYYHADLAAARAGWARDARIALRELYRFFPFDVVVCPSDSYVYIRDVVYAARELGIPFFVVIRETTPPVGSRATQARDLKDHFPFISDHMTVNAEGNKDWWLAAGTDPASIEVTGQPRFDFYLRPERWRSLTQLGVPTVPDRRTVLFLAYELHVNIMAAYRTGERVWTQLREETIRALGELVADETCNLVVKPHPQQSPGDIAEMTAPLKAIAGSAWGRSVSVLPVEFDARHLIMAADVVVGFQSMALFEALAAKKAVVYAAWGADPSLFERDELYDFHRHTDVLSWAQSPQELKQMVTRPITVDDRTLARRLEYATTYLGPLDGMAAHRVWLSVRRVVGEYPAPTAAQRRLREAVRRRWPWHCAVQASVAIARILFWGTAATAFGCVRFTSIGTRLFRASVRRLQKYLGRLRECVVPLGLASGSHMRLNGRTWTWLD